MSLPRFLGIQSKKNGKYLWLAKQEEEAVGGFLSFSGEEIVSPYTKFEVELSGNRRGLIHIRCCYNNRYLSKISEEGDWIIAGSKEKEEDESKWLCTLFEPVRIEDSSTHSYYFRHVRTLRPVFPSLADPPPFYAGLRLGPVEEEKGESVPCTIIDWESLVILPRCVTFKGHDGKYLGIYQRDGNPYVVFEDGEAGDRKFWHEVVRRWDGSVCIRANVTNRFWQTVYSWLRASAQKSSPKNIDNTWFWPVKVNGQVIALRNYKYKDTFCTRDPAAGWPDGFAALAPTITKGTQVIVEEPVLDRLIYNVHFRLPNSRIYNTKSFKIATEQAANQTNEAQTITLELPYLMTKTNTWACSSTFKSGVKTSIQAFVPSIYEGEVDFIDEFSGEFRWGRSRTSSRESMKTYKAAVGPRTKVTVSLYATKGSCDVPFSYTQRDTLTDGKIAYFDMNDGLYTSTTLFNFRFETKEEAFPCENEVFRMEVCAT